MASWSRQVGAAAFRETTSAYVALRRAAQTGTATGRAGWRLLAQPNASG